MSTTIDGITYQLVDATNATVFSASGIVNANIESTVSFAGSYSNVPVTTITSGVFSGNTDLQTVTFSENSYITTLNDAFSECSNLTSITLPSSVTTIDYNTFYNCSSLASITLPSSVTTIGDYSFDSCHGLTNVNVYNQSTCTVQSDSFTDVSENESSQITFYNTVSVGNLTSNWAQITNKFYTTDYIPGPPENPPTIGDLDIPDKTMGDAPFEIVEPTSDSAGAFTYTSSDENVATIVDTNYIQIVGVGTSTITANQAANGSYTAGSVETVFTVSENSPSNPATIGTSSSLVYFLETGEDFVYANIDAPIVVTEDLLSASYKVITISDNSVTIVKNILG